MENATMGRVLTEATIENLGDLLEVDKGQRKAEEVRRVTVTDALVDTGATMLSLPSSMIQQLCLTKQYTKKARSTTGVTDVDVYSVVRLTIQDRYCPLDVMEVPDGTPVLIGQIPLEQLDLVVDLQGGKLIGNPAHGGEQMFELY